MSLGLVCLAGALSVFAADRPNILWITIEDTSPHFIGCYGDENAHTPNIDRLAREGVRFTRAFATGPVCSSSRSTIFTGARTYEMGTGNHRSAYPVPEYMNGRILMGENRTKPTDHLILSANRSDNGIDVMRAVTHGDYFYTRNFMAYMPEERYKSYSEISDIMQQMRDDLGDGELDELQESLFIPRPPEFLFNIKDDPWETKNLANGPAQQKRLDKMRRQLEKESLSKRDVMLLPEYEIDLIPKTGTAYEFRLDDKNYPIKEVVAAASLSGFRGGDITKEQVALLISPNRFVRYWVAVGLLSQSKEDLAPHQEAIAKAMNDAYPPAGATVAAVVWKHFGTHAAEQKVKEYLRYDNWLINLMTVNYLFYIDNREPFVETINALHERSRLGVAQAEKKFKQRVKNV